MEGLGQPTNINRDALSFFSLERNLESGKKKSYCIAIWFAVLSYLEVVTNNGTHLVHSRNLFLKTSCIIHSISLIAHWNQRAQKPMRLRLNHSSDDDDMVVEI